MAVTRVCKIVTLLLKNAIRTCAEPDFCFVHFVFAFDLLINAESKSCLPGPITGSFSFPKFQLFTLSAVSQTIDNCQSSSLWELP
jgi:hypothetical protein